MPTDLRSLVWNGQREKTLGGLKKRDLVKNSKGKIVSKRKSEVARKLNNLGLGLGKGKRKPKKKPPTSKINPITQQPKGKKGLSEISLDNVILKKGVKKKAKKEMPKIPKLTLGERLKLKKLRK